MCSASNLPEINLDLPRPAFADIPVAFVLSSLAFLVYKEPKLLKLSTCFLELSFISSTVLPGISFFLILSLSSNLYCFVYRCSTYCINHTPNIWKIPICCRCWYFFAVYFKDISTFTLLYNSITCT